MHTWVYVHNERQTFVEITWFEYEVSVGEGEFGSVPEAPMDDEAAPDDNYDDDDDEDDHGGGDALDALDAADDPYVFDEFTEPDEPDYERRSIPTLSVDEAFQEQIKENPYDLSIDPRREDEDDDGLSVIDGDPYR